MIIGNRLDVFLCRNHDQSKEIISCTLSRISQDFEAHRSFVVELFLYEELKIILLFADHVELLGLLYLHGWHFGPKA